MALTPLRWGAIVAAGMLLIVAMSLTLPEPRLPAPDRLERMRLMENAATASGRAQTFALQFRVARLSDSLRAAVPRSADRGIRVMHAANVAPPVRAAVEAAVARAQSAIGAPVAGIDVVTVVDTMPVRGYRMASEGIYPFYMLPDTPAQRCVAVLPLGRRWNDSRIRELSTDAVADRLLGPCAFHAAFGVPGPAVHRWLRARGATLALGGSWVRPPGRMQTPPTTNAFTRHWFNVALEFFSYSGLRCALGETAECERSIMTATDDPSPWARPRPMVVGSSVSPNYSLMQTWRRRGADFGDRETGILAGMVRSLGREKFAAFWTSADSVPLAFEKASGQPLGAWVSIWANEQIEPLERGPTIPPVVLLETILLVTLCLAMILMIGRRREFA